MNTSTGTTLWKRAKLRIPGGSQLLSKRAEQLLPEQWPAYYDHAKGVEVWDLDGNKFVDMALMGVGSCTLGYADPDVDAAVKQVIDKGSMCSLNAPEEVELADLLCALHPWAEMVRFARTGGESMAIAVRIARAFAKREKVAFCGYHGWADWYLAANLSDEKNLEGHLLPGLAPVGVPKGLQGTMLPFHYNRIDELEAIVAKHPDVGVIVLEPMRHHEPENGFLEKVRAIADRINAVLVFDEVSIGWRLAIGGSHLSFGVTPDIAVFGKAMGNGFPMTAIIGKRDVMQAAQETFISSTYWTERTGPVAALATIRKMQAVRLPEHLKSIGAQIWEGWIRLSKQHGLDISILGPEALVTFSLNYGEESQKIKTLLTQLMLERGFFDNGCVYVSLAHTEQHVRDYLEAQDEVFGILKRAIEEKTVEGMLKGPAAHRGFTRLT